MTSLQAGRDFLKATLWEEWGRSETDQRKRVPPPPLQKPYPADAVLVDLVAPNALTVGQMPLIEAMRRRRSRRKFTPEPLTLEELSFLCWATQGVAHVAANKTYTLRTVASGGARHAFETYLWVNRVTGLQAGLYRYLALDHRLCLVRAYDTLGPQVVAACGAQDFCGSGAVTFLWTAIPYRSEWRYGVVAAKLIAQDSGHVCQHLYLACEAIGAGCCAVGAYHQKSADALLGVDGEDEFVIYIAPVGKVA